MEHVNIPGIMSPTNLCVATDESPFPQGSSDGLQVSQRSWAAEATVGRDENNT